MTVTEELRARRDLLAQPGVWVPRCPEREGESCLIATYGGSATSAEADRGRHPADLSTWNDSATLDEVLALLDRTIARLEASA